MWKRRDYTVRIVESGRYGTIRYAEDDGHAYEFYWEFGGGRVVAAVSIPMPGEWDSVIPWAAGRRPEILDRVADEVRRQKCPRCSPVVRDKWLEFLDPAADTV